jgi:hypothetical protein
LLKISVKINIHNVNLLSIGGGGEGKTPAIPLASAPGGGAMIQTWEGWNNFQYNNLLLGGSKIKTSNKN